MKNSISVLWVYSVESVSKLWLAFSITLLIFFAIYGVTCVKLAHSSLGDREMLYSSSYHHHPIGSINLSRCCQIFRGCVTEVVSSSYAVGFIYIPGKLGVVYFNCTVLWCAQIIEYIMAWPSYSFVCTLHYHPNHADVYEGLLKCLSGIFCRAFL